MYKLVTYLKVFEDPENLLVVNETQTWDDYKKIMVEKLQLLNGLKFEEDQWKLKDGVELNQVKSKILDGFLNNFGNAMGRACIEKLIQLCLFEGHPRKDQI